MGNKFRNKHSRMPRNVHILEYKSKKKTANYKTL